MSKSRVPNSKAKGDGAFERFLGISLSAGKAERTCLSVLDYYPKENRLFLSELVDKIHTEEFITADVKLLEHVSQFADQTRSIFFDCPLTLPAYFEPGADPEAEMNWMIAELDKQAKRPRPKKNFTPYTQRSTDLYYALAMKGILEVHHALGANLAPLTARGKYLKSQLKAPTFETNTKIAVWRIGHELGLRKSHLKNHRSAVLGQATRREFLKAFTTQAQLFIYEQDTRLLIDQAPAFDSLMSALMGFWQSQGLVEKMPVDFPAKAAWIETPDPNGVLARIDQK